MGPTNNHELAIARIVDNIDIAGRLYPTSIDEVIARLNFALTKADSNFLIDYIRWRMDNPIAK
jgi:hypothetical protein